MNLSPTPTDRRTFVFSANGSQMVIWVHLFPEKLGVDIGVHGKRKFNSMALTRWLEDAAIDLQRDWGVPCKSGWFALHDALQRFVAASGGSEPA